MPLKVSELLEQTQNLQGLVWPLAAQMAAEAAGESFHLGTTSEQAIEVSDLVDLGHGEMLCLSFSLAHLPVQTQVLLIDSTSLQSLFSALQGELVTTLTESLVQAARPMFEGLVSGISQGVGKARGEATAPSLFEVHLSRFSPPDSLLRSQVILKATAELMIRSATIPVIWLFNEEALHSMVSKERGNDRAFNSRAHSSEVGPSGTPPEDASLQLLFDIPLEISVELGRVRMLVKDVLELGAGSIVEIEKAAGEPVDVLVNGKYVARGEVVVIEDNFGVRITEILTPAERLARLNEAA